jgi:hypothetical protein
LPKRCISENPSQETHKINVAVAAISTDQNPGLATNLRQILIDDLNNSGFLTVVPSASDATSPKSKSRGQLRTKAAVSALSSILPRLQLVVN